MNVEARLSFLRERIRACESARMRRLLPIVMTSLVLSGASLSGCAYPRRTTSLSPVRTEAFAVGPGSAPADVYKFTLISATANQRNRGNAQWDDNNGLPDLYVRILRDGVVVWESETVDDSITPTWNATIPRNLSIPNSARLQLEVWDRDAVGGDPVGIWRGVGLPPNARNGVEARVLLEGESFLTIRVDSPMPHRGVGIRLFEVHDGDLQVVELEPHSPASRAGLVVGDRIIAVGSTTVSQLGSARASGALSMAAERNEALRVVNAQGVERTVTLDRGYVWLVL